jgi:hypothetical protein
MAIEKTLIDQLLADYKKPEDIIGENGLLKQLTKAILERALQAELTDHLALVFFPGLRVGDEAVGILSGTAHRLRAVGRH